MCKDVQKTPKKSGHKVIVRALSLQSAAVQKSDRALLLLICSNHFP